MRTIQKLYGIFMLVSILSCMDADAQGFKPTSEEFIIKVVDRDNVPVENADVYVGHKRYATNRDGILKISHTFTSERETLPVRVPMRHVPGWPYSSDDRLAELFPRSHYAQGSIVFRINNHKPNTLSASDVKHLPSRDLTTMISALGVPVSNNGSMAGTRPENTVYYIDGIMVRGSDGFIGLRNNSFRK